MLFLAQLPTSSPSFAGLGVAPRLAVIFVTVVVLIGGMVAITMSWLKRRRAWRIAAYVGMVPWLVLCCVLVFQQMVRAQAAVPGTSGAAAGFLFGSIMGGLLVLAFFAASIAAVTTAYVKRTPMWLVLGAVGAIVVIAFLVPFSRGVFVGMQNGMQNGAQQAGAAPASLDLGEPTETVTGQTVPFTFRIPKGWTSRQGSGAGETAMTYATGRNIYVKMIGEEGYYGATDVLVSVLRKRLATTTREVAWDPLETETVDGKTWAVANIRTTLINPPISVVFRVHFYAGPEGSYTCLLWTAPNLFDRNRAQMDKIFQTFKFPPQATPAPAPSPAPAATPAADPAPAAAGTETPAPASPATPAPETPTTPATPVPPPPAPTDPSTPVS